MCVRDPVPVPYEYWPNLSQDPPGRNVRAQPFRRCVRAECGSTCRADVADARSGQEARTVWLLGGSCAGGGLAAARRRGPRARPEGSGGTCSRSPGARRRRVDQRQQLRRNERLVSSRISHIYCCVGPPIGASFTRRRRRRAGRRRRRRCRRRRHDLHRLLGATRRRPRGVDPRLRAPLPPRLHLSVAELGSAGEGMKD